ncbi:MAG: hypothetical protein IPN17_32030 [Deltaproteobacteria bacterium]|nr:hypothetical protein [Deltaproteobacteria bacterium]
MSDALDRVAIAAAAAIDLEDLVGYIAERNPAAAETGPAKPSSRSSPG